MVKEKLSVKKRTTTVAIAGSQVKSVRFVSTEKSGFRVIKDGKIGVFGMTGKGNEAEAWAKAEQNLENQIPYPVEAESGKKESADNTPALLGDKRFVDETERFLAMIKQECPKFIFSNNIQKVELFKKIENDQDLDLSFKTGYYIVSLIVKDEASANVFDLGYSYVGREFSPEKMAADVKNFYDAYYREADVEEGERLVIGSVTDFGFSKIYEDILSDTYCNGTGLFAGKAGQQVLDERVTIYEDRSKDSWSTPFFDDEGVSPEDGKNYLFKEGEFVAPLACKSDAKKYGLERAGFGSSSYDGVPQTSLSGLTIKGSGKTLEELTAGEDAVLLVMASGGDTTPDGNFATPVQASFLVRGGKLVGRLPALNIAGNIFDIYGKNFVGRAEDNPLLLCDGDDGKPVVVRMSVSK